MPRSRRFKQVDVFTQTPFLGNPLAVVLDAEEMTDIQMQAMARWTNLSETTFVLPPSDPRADYRVRIFTPEYELPFAGHPTLGTAHALLEAGILSNVSNRIVQECGVGLVTIEKTPHGALAFQAPEAQFQALSRESVVQLEAALNTSSLHPEHAPALVNMGIRWLVVRLTNAAACLAVRPNPVRFAELRRWCEADGIALYGTHPEGLPAYYEVRALIPEHGMVVEDPVTGSANACIARLLQQQGFPDGLSTRQGYSVRQGTVLERDGRLQVRYASNTPWIEGHSVTVIDGTLNA
ncbi:PhzF family phenazine biosynthesis protein [Pseudomonas duriflava]|uniref:PhzF family phenazine biosynthesis protein n=1 Tax=Pseudomonas duriflava TaxID=459528 RepID=A0A562Q6Y4_9PSED|nr:PhzF family phenazine biosynthesis protein [Pseudomonas duriflava]TWI52512.1 PhzF family phenazine biosynthesis protein [Pseudomonas duriflava]